MLIDFFVVLFVIFARKHKMADIEEYNTDNLNYDEEVPDLGEGGATEEANGGGAEANGGDEAMEVREKLSLFSSLLASFSGSAQLN